MGRLARLLGLLALLGALALQLLASGVAAERSASHVAAGESIGVEADVTTAAAAAQRVAMLESHATLRRAASAMRKIGRLRLRARAAAAVALDSAAEQGQESQSALSLGAAATLEALARAAAPSTPRGAGGKAGRAGGKGGAAAGNAGQSGRKAGDAAGNGGQSGRKAGDAAGNGGQSGRKAGDASGNGGQSGRKAGDASGDAGQSGRKAGDLPPVSPITGSPPPDSSNVVPVAVSYNKAREKPVHVYLRNQGDGATCWAQSAMTLLELRQQMSLVGNGKFTTWLSVDQVVKCVPNDGAGGGSPLDALQFLLNSRILTDAEVRAGKAITCDSIKSKAERVGDFALSLAFRPCITPGANCAHMRDYEFQMDFEFMLTPMLAYVDASQWDSYKPAFNAAQVESYAAGTASDYSSVAFPTSKCSMDPAKGDHIAILLGTVTCPKTQKKYWRVFNSWGKEWGVNGYIYLPFEENACGLANYPVGLVKSSADSAPSLMLPRTMSQAEAMASPEFETASGMSGGKELYARQMQLRAQAAK